MRIERREDFLKIAVAVVVGLFLLDRMILSPALVRWKDQGERIAKLREDVTEGQRLLKNEHAIRAKWDDMQRNDLDPEISLAEDQAYKGISRWATASRVSVSSLTPAWRTLEDHDLYEFRASMTGTQSSLGQFIYDLGVDKLPVRLEECELTTRDNKGQMLGGSMRFSFIRLKDAGGRP
jgi:hypothetical protein